MRKYSEARYIPYIRVRQKSVSRGKIPANAYFGNIIVSIRNLLCAACLVLTLINAGNKLDLIFSGIIENNAVEIVNEFIDKGIYNAKNYYIGNDFFVISQNTDSQLISVKNDVMEAKLFASVLSECIYNEIKAMEHVKYRNITPAISENGLLASVLIKIPYRIVSMGKVKVTPVFSVEKNGFNQTIHRLEMDISLNIGINISLLRKQKFIRKIILISETVIS